MTSVWEAAPDRFQRTVLGRTGLQVGRLGVAASYGVPGTALEWAFERGVNYSRRYRDFSQAHIGSPNRRGPRRLVTATVTS